MNVNNVYSVNNKQLKIKKKINPSGLKKSIIGICFKKN